MLVSCRRIDFRIKADIARDGLYDV